MASEYDRPGWISQPRSRGPLEAGWNTPKFDALRQLFLQHLAPGERLPDVPARNPVITIRPVEPNEVAPLFANLPAAKKAVRPESMERYDQSHGCILYRTKLPASDGEKLVIKELHDYGLVFLGGKKLATLDRRKSQDSVTLPAHPAETMHDLLVDTFGHVNYGPDIYDSKGITEKVELVIGGKTNELTGWEVFNLPLDAAQLRTLKFEQSVTDMPAFYRTTFRLAHTGDTFLDLSNWGKGVVWVNGHKLGRFWNIGPQQTLYCPGSWLKPGRNELIVFEFNGTQKHTVSVLTEPILNQVHE